MNLLDTDKIIELLQKRQHEVGATSTITLIEVLRVLDTEKRSKAKELLEESFNIQIIDNKIMKPTAAYTKNSEKRAYKYPTPTYL